jgi:hypothetical protein
VILGCEALAIIEKMHSDNVNNQFKVVVSLNKKAVLKITLLIYQLNRHLD